MEMTLKITNTPFGPAATSSTRLDKSVARAYGASGSAPSSSAEVALSATGHQLLALDGEGDIDMDRVQAIRDAIASGQLKIDPSRIADSLIASAQELLK